MTKISILAAFLVFTIACSSAPQHSVNESARNPASINPCESTVGSEKTVEKPADFFSRKFGVDTQSVKAIARCRRSDAPLVDSVVTASDEEDPGEFCVLKGTAGGRPALMITFYDHSTPGTVRAIIKDGNDRNGSVKVGDSGIQASENWSYRSEGVFNQNNFKEMNFDSYNETFHFREGKDGSVVKEFTATCRDINPGH